VRVVGNESANDPESPRTALINKVGVNRVALITGASSGIGRALAELLAEQGYAVALAARGAERLDQFAALLRARHATVLTESVDVSDAAAVDRFVQRVHATWGRLDLVIANAGSYSRKPAVDVTRADLEQALATNLWGAVHVVRAALPRLLAQRSGDLVLMSSFDAKKPLPSDAAYAAAKAAAAAYAAALRQGLRGSGVHVCTVFPGRIDTPMIEALDVPAISAKVPALRAAKAVLRGVRNRRAEVFVPLRCHLLLWADTLSPTLGDWLVRVTGLDGRPRQR